MSGDEVTDRNRYANIELFAQNRVKLKVDEGTNDYINASPIQLGKRRFIATQGPKNTTVNHFYRMVASEVAEPAVVVMLTQTHEAGREKCFQYYPLAENESPMVITRDPHFEDDFEGTVELVSMEEDPVTLSEIRRLKLRATTNNGPPIEKDIIHLLFGGWPDFLVPEGQDQIALIELVRLSATLNRGSIATNATTTDDDAPSTNGTASTSATNTPWEDQDNPRIVHCSAGVGRSGTFIALDYLLSQLYAGQLDHVPENVDPIVETVDLMRQQRMMMVQTESQFVFLYTVLRDLFLQRASGDGQATEGAQRA